MIERIGLLIPSYRRHPFLSRQLDWLRGIGIREVVAVDGSPSAIPKGQQWGTWYHHLPNEGYSARLQFGIKKIKSPIVTICADDDYLSPEGLVQAVSFLLDNRCYSTAFGQYVGLRYRNNNWDLQLLYGRRRAFSISVGTRERRLALWMKNYMHSFYSPHRLEHIRHVIGAIPAQADPGLPKEAEAANLVELAVAISDAWFGGRMVFPQQLYMVRQATVRTATIPSPDWVEANRPAEFRNWVRLYSSRFARSVGVNEADFEAFWMNGYGFYRDSFVASQRTPNRKGLSRLRSAVPPAIRSLVRRHILGPGAKPWSSPFEQCDNVRITEIFGHIARFPLTLPAEAAVKEKQHDIAGTSK